jgi:hypothetical protein
MEEDESVAYTTNSKAQEIVKDLVGALSRVALPLATYSGPHEGLMWHNMEAPTPQLAVSHEDDPVPRPRFELKKPQPSVDPLRSLMHMTQSLTLGASGQEAGGHPEGFPVPQPNMLMPAWISGGQGLAGHATRGFS